MANEKTVNPLATALTSALANAATTEDTKTPKPSHITVGAPIAMIDDSPDGLAAGDGDFDRLFTAVIFTPVSGDVYARERDRRNKPSVTVGYSRKVADVQIELAGTGAYTPGVISVVQGIADKSAHLEMSVGVWNPDTRKTSILCSTESTKARFMAWKDKTCAEFLAYCLANGIDLANPGQQREHANSLSTVNLLSAVKPNA